jgi:hypothetical protein
MEKQMVQCEDGRRRQARIQGLPTEEGDFRVWKAGVRLKGKVIKPKPGILSPIRKVSTVT